MLRRYNTPIVVNKCKNQDGFYTIVPGFKTINYNIDVINITFFISSYATPCPRTVLNQAKSGEVNGFMTLDKD